MEISPGLLTPALRFSPYHCGIDYQQAGSIYGPNNARNKPSSQRASVLIRDDDNAMATAAVLPQRRTLHASLSTILRSSLADCLAAAFAK